MKWLLSRIFMAVGLMALVVSSHAQTARPVQTFDTSACQVKITPIYHATLLIQAGGKNIYVDPAKPASFAGLPPADLILVTDIHGDHVDEHRIEVDAAHPADCTPQHRCSSHEASHAHSATCGHARVPHGDHTDFLVEGHLHHPHGDHCDNHGDLIRA